MPLNHRRIQFSPQILPERPRVRVLSPSCTSTKRMLRRGALCGRANPTFRSIKTRLVPTWIVRFGAVRFKAEKPEGAETLSGRGVRETGDTGESDASRKERRWASEVLRAPSCARKCVACALAAKTKTTRYDYFASTRTYAACKQLTGESNSRVARGGSIRRLHDVPLEGGLGEARALLRAELLVGHRADGQHLRATEVVHLQRLVRAHAAHRVLLQPVVHLHDLRERTPQHNTRHDTRSACSVALAPPAVCVLLRLVVRAFTIRNSGHLIQHASPSGVHSLGGG
eukprot:611043-Prorocentrum_minimum.AAC.1